MSSRITLSLEEREALAELAQFEGMEAMFRLMDEIITVTESRLLEGEVRSGQETDFIYNKCRIEGAKKLKNELASYLAASKKPIVTG